MSILFFFCALAFSGCAAADSGKNPYPEIPGAAAQLIVVTGAGWDSPQGELQRYERDASGRFRCVGRAIPVLLGRNGLAWGRGVKDYTAQGSPAKREGDGRAPAGVFFLDGVFGMASPDSAQGITKMPYRQLDELTECVEDRDSRYYNRILERDGKADWSSSERMYRMSDVYKWGVTVAHNTKSTERGGGSCIFLHILKGPSVPTSGCTAMNENELLEIIAWLDPAKKPLLLQIPAAEKKKFLPEE